MPIMIPDLVKVASPSTLTLTDLEKVSLFIEPIDAAGNPASVENITWGCSDPSILTVEQVNDPEQPRTGTRAIVTTVGPLGTARVTVEADALLGDGVELIQGFLDVVVVGSKAVSFTVGAGTPILK
jgi:hypothetical protein